MTPEQTAQLQELAKCYCLPRHDSNFVKAWLDFSTEDDRFGKREKRILRRLWRQYRGQIVAMKRNRIVVYEEDLQHTCGDCGAELTIVRPGKCQCDNPQCKQNLYITADI